MGEDSKVTNNIEVRGSFNFELTADLAPYSRSYAND